jgi:hypothetical protein
MRIFGRHWDPLELAFATAGLLLSVATVLVPAHARFAVAVVLATVFLVFAVHWVIRKARTTYVLPGVRPVVTELSNLARKSTRSVWTARAHLGEGEIEDDFFHAIASRVLEGSVDDFRRVIHLSKARGTRVHLHWLIDKFADQPAVKVRFLKSSTGLFSLFSLAVFDGRQAVLGFPQIKGEGFLGAMFTRDSVAVKGLETAFQLLEAHSTVLFRGTKHITEHDRQRMKDRIDEEIDLLPDDLGIAMPANQRLQPGTSGTAEQLISHIVEKKAKGDPTVEKIIKVKLLLKGIDSSKFSGNSPDDPVVIDKLLRIAADFGLQL